jgi:hypothetical protein
MKVVIRDIGTGLFFQEPAGWVADIAKARAFVASGEAMKVAERRGMKSAEVVFRFDDAKYNFAITCAPEDKGHWAKRISAVH